MQNSQLTPKVRVETGASSWLPKLSKFLVLLIFLLASTQLGLHLWPDSSLLHGIRVDYLSPVIYFLDLLIIGYLIARRSVLKGVEVISPDEQPRRTDLIGTLAPLLLTNLLFSTNPLATLSWSLHFLLYFVFVSTFPLSILHNSLPIILSLTMLFQVFLGAIQVSLDHTLQGPLYWLGERALSVATPNAARGEFLGRVMLRAYGTFNHPNILAGWLVVSLLILIYLIRRGQEKGQILLGISVVLTSLGILLTQSRSAAFALFGIIIPFYLLKKLRHRILYIAISLCVMYYALSPNIFSRLYDTSLTDRLTLQQISLQVTQAYPIFGAGANSSISSYPTIVPHNRLLQPDHNSFALFLSWFGIFGLLAIIMAVRPHLQSLHTIFYVLIPIAPLLVLDHYLLTSPQGILIFLLYLRFTLYSHNS